MPANETFVQTVQCRVLPSEYHCVYCQKPQPGDTCRFVGIRQLTTENGEITANSFISNSGENLIEYPDSWSSPVTLEHLLDLRVSLILPWWFHFNLSL